MEHSDPTPFLTKPGQLELAVSELGPLDAPPVLVLHGITASRRYWLPRLAPLARDHRLLIPDLPGFGDSPKPFAEYTPAFFVEALLGLLARRLPRPEPLRLIGHSLGGLIALEIAARAAVEVERVVLLSLPRFGSPEEAHRVMLDGSGSYRRLLTLDSFGANLAQARRAGWRLGARYLRRLPWPVVADARKFTFRSLSSTIENCLLHHDLAPAIMRYPGTTPPPLLIHGALDPVAPLDGVLELCARPPHPVLHVIPDAAHNPFHTHTARCLGLFESYLTAPPEELARHASPP